MTAQIRGVTALMTLVDSPMPEMTVLCSADVQESQEASQTWSSL